MRTGSRKDSTARRERYVGVITEQVTAFGRNVLRGVVSYANLQRNWVLFTETWRAGGPSHWPQCDGLIVGGVSLKTLAQQGRQTRNVVGCSGNLDPREMPVVTADNRAIGVMAAEHLIEQGLRHFAFYGPDWATNADDPVRANWAFTLRAGSFQKTLQDHGYSLSRCDVSPVFEDMLSHEHHPKLIQWLSSLPRPIGVFCADDPHAYDLAKACSKGNIRVPDDVAIIGTNNDDLYCEIASPPLTSIECNFVKIGYLAAQMLDRLMRGEELAPDERLIEVPPARVLKRMSTDIIAVDQPEVSEAIHYIRKHACDPCSIADILKIVPVSRRTLERLFQQRLGRTIHDEIVRVQMETARRLLLEPNLKVPEIGERCGFSTVQSFNRCFNRVTGTTPAVFRRQNLPADKAR